MGPLKQEKGPLKLPIKEYLQYPKGGPLLGCAPHFLPLNPPPRPRDAKPIGPVVSALSKLPTTPSFVPSCLFSFHSHWLLHYPPFRLFQGGKGRGFQPHIIHHTPHTWQVGRKGNQIKSQESNGR